MNVFKAIYCRTFQFIMKVAIPFLPYRQPKILQTYDEIVKILKEKNIGKVLLVTDKGVEKCGLTDGLTESLHSGAIEVAVYDETMPNPTVEAVENAVEIYKKNLCQAVIALGGGSAMDLSKACGARIVRPKKSLIKMGGLLKVRKKLPPLIAIPTTAGTGSETTIAAVITDGATHRKYAINDFSLIPRYAVLNYNLTLKLPEDLTAYTGMDAMTHAVEAYIGRSTTKDTRKKAVEAVKLINENIEKCYFTPEDIEARQNMLFASHYAGIAFTKSYVGYVHAVAHSLSGRYGLGHGLTNAVLLPVVLSLYGKKIHKKLKKLAVLCGIAQKEESKQVCTEKFINRIKELNKIMNVPEKFDVIEDKDIPQMAKYADREGNPLYPVPVLMNAKQLEKIYYMVKA